MTENSLKINIRLYGLTAMLLLLINSCKDDRLKGIYVWNGKTQT